MYNRTVSGSNPRNSGMKEQPFFLRKLLGGIDFSFSFLAVSAR